MEIFGAGKILPDELGAKNLAMPFDQAPIRLFPKEKLTQSGDNSRVNETRQQVNSAVMRSAGINCCSMFIIASYTRCIPPEAGRSARCQGTARGCRRRRRSVHCAAAGRPRPPAGISRRAEPVAPAR